VVVTLAEISLYLLAGIIGRFWNDARSAAAASASASGVPPVKTFDPHEAANVIDHTALQLKVFRTALTSQRTAQISQAQWTHASTVPNANLDTECGRRSQSSCRLGQIRRQAEGKETEEGVADSVKGDDSNRNANRSQKNHRGAEPQRSWFGEEEGEYVHDSRRNQSNTRCGEEEGGEWSRASFLRP